MQMRQVAGRRVLMTAVSAAVLFFGALAQAQAGVTVKRIDEAALDRLMQARDNRLLVSFMAAWCGPCMDELPVLNRLYKKHNPAGMRLIGISIDPGGPAAMQPIVDGLKIDFPVYWYGEKAVAKFQMTAIPLLIFIRQGKIAERIYGRRSEAFLEEKIRSLFYGPNK